MTLSKSNVNVNIDFTAREDNTAKYTARIECVSYPCVFERPVIQNLNESFEIFIERVKLNGAELMMDCKLANEELADLFNDEDDSCCEHEPESSNI